MHKILMNTLHSIFVRGLQNPVCIFHSYNSLFLIDFTCSVATWGWWPHTGWHRLGGCLQCWYCLTLGRNPELSEGQISDQHDGNTAFLLAHPQKASPLTCLVSVSPARDSITIFPFHLWRCPGSGWHFPQPLTVCFICSLHWSRVSTQSHSFPQAAPLSHLPTLVLPLQKKRLSPDSQVEPSEAVGSRHREGGTRMQRRADLEPLFVILTSKNKQGTLGKGHVGQGTQ